MQLELRHISKTIKGKQILDDVNLKLESGHVYGLIGKNGSGKTMLIRLCAGIMRSTSGEILWNGRDAYAKNNEGPEIGIIIENTGVYPEFTGFKNLSFLAGIRKKVGGKEIRDAIVRVGLDPDDKRIVKKYSLGMKQRIVLAQAIMEKPDILLLDEPTNALDDLGVELFYDIVREEKARGALVIIASHSKEDIAKLCDETFLVKEGRVENSISGGGLI